MNSPFSQTKKKPLPVNSSILESLRDLSSGVGRTVAKDLPTGMVNDAFSAFFGTPGPTSGDLRPEQPVELGSRENNHSRPGQKEAGNHLQHLNKEEAGLKEKIEAVRAELVALAKSLKSLHTEIEKAVTEVPVTPGVYHANFYERIRSMLQLLREHVDDSSAWMSMHTKRQKRKVGYWGMYKKHGTTFGLSQERTLATQAG